MPLTAGRGPTGAAAGSGPGWLEGRRQAASLHPSPMSPVRHEGRSAGQPASTAASCPSPTSGHHGLCCCRRKPNSVALPCPGPVSPCIWGADSPLPCPSPLGCQVTWSVLQAAAIRRCCGSPKEGSAFARGSRAHSHRGPSGSLARLSLAPATRPPRHGSPCGALPIRPTSRHPCLCWTPSTQRQPV